MNESTLRVLMADGLVTARFVPALSPKQYADVYAMVAIFSTRDELEQAIQTAADQWGMFVDFGGVEPAVGTEIAHQPAPPGKGFVSPDVTDQPS